MRYTKTSLLLAGAVMSASLMLSAEVASAACTRLGFSVNDYGKVGPANDAKRLLDGYIAKEMAKKGVSNYRTGTKSVKCELFLDFVVFDEYTCRAEATVCWGGSSTGSSSSSAEADAVSDPEPNERAGVSTGSISKSDDDKAPVVAPIDP